MRLLVLIGPDIVATARYSSKASLRVFLDRASKRRSHSDISCEITVFNRRYSSSEIRNAEVVTLTEFFKIHEEET